MRDTSSGQVRLATEKQLFFPGKDELIEEVRPLIKLVEVFLSSLESRQTTKRRHERGQPLQSQDASVWWRSPQDLRFEDAAPKAAWPGLASALLTCHRALYCEASGRRQARGTSQSEP